MQTKFRLDPGLRPYATDRQWEILEAWDKATNRKAAAKQLGVGKSTVQDAKDRVEKKAAQKGYAPNYDLVHPAAPGMSSRGTSILYDGEGKVHEYWNKTKQEGRDPDDTVQLPDPKTIVKLSTLYDQEGNVTQQWVAEKPEAVAQANAWKEFAKALTEDLPRIERLAPQLKRVEEILEEGQNGGTNQAFDAIGRALNILRIGNEEGVSEEER